MDERKPPVFMRGLMLMRSQLGIEIREYMLTLARAANIFIIVVESSKNRNVVEVS